MKVGVIATTICMMLLLDACGRIDAKDWEDNKTTSAAAETTSPKAGESIAVLAGSSGESTTTLTCAVVEVNRTVCKGVPGNKNLTSTKCVEQGCCYQNETWNLTCYNPETTTTTTNTTTKPTGPNTTEGKSITGFEMLGLPMMPLLATVMVAILPMVKTLLAAAAMHAK